MTTQIAEPLQPLCRHQENKLPDHPGAPHQPHDRSTFHATTARFFEPSSFNGLLLNRHGGGAEERPTEFRHLSTWFGHDDLVQMLMRCIEVPQIGYMAIWGVSNNTRSYWDQTGTEKLGYRPVQNSEDYAADILAQPNPLDPIAQTFQGGSFTTMDYTPPDQRSASPRQK